MTSVQPSSPRTARHSLLLSAFAAVLAGFGLGTLVLGFARPVPEVAPLPAPAPAPAGENEAGVETPPPAEPAQSPWPAAFGEPPPAPVQADPEPEEAPPQREESPPPDPEPDYILRGVITEPDGGWVLAEGALGIELVRLGERLSDGERVIEITRQGVVLESAGEYFLIEFDEDAGFGGGSPTRLDRGDFENAPGEDGPESSADELQPPGDGSAPTTP